MNNVIQSLMKKRQTPKKQLCGKHNVKLSDYIPPHAVSIGNVRTKPKKICLECENETNKA